MGKRVWALGFFLGAAQVGAYTPTLHGPLFPETKTKMEVLEEYFNAGTPLSENALKGWHAGRCYLGDNVYGSALIFYEKQTSRGSQTTILLPSQFFPPEFLLTVTIVPHLFDPGIFARSLKKHVQERINIREKGSEDSGFWTEKFDTGHLEKSGDSFVVTQTLKREYGDPKRLFETIEVTELRSHAGYFVGQLSTSTKIGADPKRGSKHYCYYFIELTDKDFYDPPAKPN